MSITLGCALVTGEFTCPTVAGSLGDPETTGAGAGAKCRSCATVNPMTESEIAQFDVPDSPFDTKLGLEITERSAERVCGRAPVAGNTQPYGLWHGGASCVLAETLASVAGTAAVGQGGRAVGVELNATHHEAVREGYVNGEARALRVGRTLGTWEVILTDDSGRRVCTARVTCALRGPKRD